MKLKEPLIKYYAEQFAKYKDMLNHPAWRELVEEPLLKEIEWARAEIDRMMTEGRPTAQVCEEARDLGSYVQALRFVLHQIMRREQLGRASAGWMQKRAEQLGLAKEEEIQPPKFEEVG